MFCPKCGAKNDDTAKFCNACGAPLQSNVPAANNGNDSSAQSTPSSTENIESSTSFISKRRIKLIVGAAVIATAIVGVVLFNPMGGNDASQNAGSSALLQESNTGGSQETNITPPQGDFIFGGWRGFHIEGDNIRISYTESDGSDDGNFLNSGTVIYDSSDADGTTWKIETDEIASDREMYVQIPNSACEGNIEGAWTIMIIAPGENGEEDWCDSQRLQFNADGTAYIDYLKGTDPAANFIENGTSHDEIKLMDQGVSIDSKTSIDESWTEIDEGRYSYSRGIDTGTAIISPDEQ